MSDAVDFVVGTDPLLRDVRLDHVRTLPVLGIPTRFETNSNYVLDLIDEIFGGWQVVKDLIPASSEKRVRVIVMPDARDVRHVSIDADRIVAHAGPFALSDPGRDESVIYTTPSQAADRVTFRTTTLEAMTMALLSHFDRHPVHAAAIARGGRAVLLAGPSGAGKSTLAHVAHDAGIDVMSEDSVWIQREPALRVWGWPGHARLLSGDSADKHRVPLRGAANAACYVAERAVVCVLQRGPHAALQPIDADAIRAALENVAPGFDRFADRHVAVTHALAKNGGWHLTLTTTPRDALPYLEEMLNPR